MKTRPRQIKPSSKSDSFYGMINLLGNFLGVLAVNIHMGNILENQERKKKNLYN